MLKFLLHVAAIILQRFMGNPRTLNPLIYLSVDQRIHNPDSDSSHITSESVDLTNLDSTDYGWEIRLMAMLDTGHPMTLDTLRTNPIIQQLVEERIAVMESP